MVPWWFVLLVVPTTLLAAPRIAWRFTLRALLTAITLAAVALGLAVYAARK
jgi:hypothetical protein